MDDKDKDPSSHTNDGPSSMTEEPPGPNPRSGFPASPCVNVCKLDRQNVCVGCRRTLDEIARWSAMTSVEQWKVVDELPGRRT